MVEVRSTVDFDKWLTALRDRQAKARVLVRIDRLAAGNPGDCEGLGEGVMEMRIHYGAGYRVYFVLRAETLIFLLAGGDKHSQTRDIGTALELARKL